MPRLRVVGSALSRTAPGSLLARRQRDALPPSSLVLSCMLRQAGHPPLTAWYVGRGEASDDQWGKSHFNWEVDGVNYHVLRTVSTHAPTPPFPRTSLHVTTQCHTA